MPGETGPDRISRYEIQGLIARGGMGRVYLARDPNTSRLVVVKLLDATLDSSDVRDRFDREARSLASLSHPNIVHIYDYGDFQDSPFIVMEYVRGETLEEKIKRRAQVSVADKLRLMSEVCAGLAHAHASGIIHRDVKPANLMVDQDERLKIIDFGIARVSDSNLTRGHSLASIGKVQIGTPGYMSPQQTQGDEIDHRTDIFSVGAVGYELLAYREAFPGATSREIESRLMRTPPEPLAGRLPDLDPEIDEILARALALDPNDRYQNATALEEALDRCRLRLAPLNTATSSRRPTPRANPVSNPSPPRADAAYARAMAAYNEQAYDVARRLVNEALAEQPDHAAARALLARLDQRPPAVAPPVRPPASVPYTAANRPARQGMRNPPETISVDPTVLIDRASMSPAPEGIEPTMVIERDDLLRRLGHAEPAPIPPASNRPARPLTEPLSRPLRSAAESSRRAPTPAADPTVMIPPKPRSPSASARPKPGFSLGAYLQPLWLSVKALGSRQPSPPRRQPPLKGASRGRGNPDWTRGALIAVGMVALAALLVVGVIQLARWFSPAGHVLTITRPVGGTILGAGLQCGTKGSACSSTRDPGEPIELSIEADAGYVFASYTGDCAPTGRLVMSQPRTCGATFDKVAVTEAATWPLTITKPTGGTVLGVNIICGTLGSDCVANVPYGQVAKLTFQTDPGHQFQQFTGDCDANGETTMTAARTCSATFMATANPRADVLPPVGPPPSRPPRREAAPPVQPTPTSAATTPPPSGPQPQSVPPGTSEAPTPIVSPDKPPPPPISAEAHAKDEIEKLVKQYCSEYETLKPERVEKLFPTSSPPRLRDQFRQYQSLKCTLTTPLEFERLDARPAGGAQVKVGIKHVIQMRSGGAPKAAELIATLRISRIDLRSPWLIDSVNYEEKPKP